MDPKALRAKRKELLTKARAVVDAATTQARAMTDDEAKVYREAMDEAGRIKTTLDAHEALEASERTIVPESQGTPSAQERETPAPARNVKPEEAGLRVARFVRALAATKGDAVRAAKFAEDRWHDDYTARALAATDAAAGGVLVPEEVSSGFIELLRPMSVVRRFNPVIVPMGSGTLMLPKLAGGAAFSYIGENKNLPKTEQTFGGVKLTFKKGGALVPVSNDLLRYASPNVDGMVRDDLVAAVAQGSDGAFIRSLGSEATPKGLRYWAPAANVIPANATVNLTNVTTDLGKLWLALANGNVRFLRPGWIFSPRTFNYLMTVRDANGNFAFREELNAGRLWGYPFAWTTQVPSNLGAGTDESEVYFTDFADAVIGEATNLVLDASTEAAYHDGSNVVAAFSLDQTVVRAIVEHDFAMRHAESVAVLTAVKWA